MIRAHAQRDISAPAEQVYALLADYQGHHRHILTPSFDNYRVEAGGHGAGTVIGFDLTLGGRRRSVRQRVDEPEPGRLLTETDLNSGARTTFVVTPYGEKSTVEIVTEFKGAPGIAGLVERLVAPRLLGRLYAEELSRLEEHIHGQ